MKALGIGLVLHAGILVVALFWPCATSADGMVVPSRAYALPNIPDQRALIHYANGTETLVIETSFVGQGTNFAWVVPLPVVAKVEPASTGFFPTLQLLFQPKIVLSVRHYWVVLPIAGCVFWLISLGRRHGFAFILLVLSLPFLLALLFAGALSSARSRAGFAPSTIANIRVLNRQSAGMFDTVTVQSPDPKALFNWLDQSGYGVPTKFAPVVEDYVRKGWVFVAARLRCESGERVPRATHPLVFVFNTERPVYPLRLTGNGSNSCRIDLYVFGPGRAAIPGFAVQRCERPSYHSGGTRVRLEPGEIRIRNRELLRWVAVAPVATKLSALLGPSEMSHDAYVGWRAYWSVGGKRYTRNAALTLSGNVAALAFMVATVIWWGWSRCSLRFQAEKWGQWLAPAALLVGAVVYVVGLSKIDPSYLRVVRGYPGTLRNNAIELANALGEEMADLNIVSSNATSTRPLTGEQLNRLYRATARDFPKVWSSYAQPLTNFFTGEPIRFEASPGNFILRPADHPERIIDNLALGTASKSYDLVWHDIDGAEAITNSVDPEHWRR